MTLLSAIRAAQIDRCVRAEWYLCAIASTLAAKRAHPARRNGIDRGFGGQLAPQSAVTSYYWFVSPPRPWHIESEGLVLQNSRNCGETVRPSVFTLPVVWASRGVPVLLFAPLLLLLLSAANANEEAANMAAANVDAITVFIGSSIVSGLQPPNSSRRQQLPGVQSTKREDSRLRRTRECG